MDDIDLGTTIKGFAAGQKIFGRYTLTRILGRGGMGVVWLARDDKLERDVALKFLPEVMMGDKLALADLKRETRRSLDLTHSHIVRIYDFVEDGRTAAIAMEYITGETLTNARAERPGHCYEPADIARWVGQICDALDYAHIKAKVVHRDLKPANLMIDAAGDVKVTDFGIATSIADSVSRVSKQAGSSGTPVYMAPQQMMGEKPAVTDDIYALGATLYDLLTGKPPFHSGNIVLQVQGKAPPPMADRREEFGFKGAPLPSDWEKTIAACLAKEPADRPQSAGEVAERLGLTAKGSAQRSTLNVERPKPKAVAADSLSKPAATDKVGQSKMPVVAGLVAAVILLGGLGWYFGLHVPEQQRLAAELARLADEKQQKELLARQEELKRQEAAQTGAERKQQAADEAKKQRQREMVAKIDALAESAPRKELDALESEMKLYLPILDVTFQQEISDHWLAKQRKWNDFFAQHEPAEVLIQTDPPGASVSLGGVTKVSPARFEKIPPGDVAAVIRLPGYKQIDTTFTIKAGQAVTAPVISLVRESGSVAIESEPRGVPFRLSGDGINVSGVTPAELPKVATGELQLVLTPAVGMEDRVDVRLAAGEAKRVVRDYSRNRVELRTVPSGAEVWIKDSLRGHTPLVLEKLAPGNLEAELRMQDYVSKRVEVKLALNENKLLEIPLVESPEAELIHSMKNSTWHWGMSIGEIYTITFAGDNNLTVDYKDNTLLGSYPSFHTRGRIASIDAKDRIFSVHALDPLPQKGFYSLSKGADFQLQLGDDGLLKVLRGKDKPPMTFTKVDAPATGRGKF